MAIYIFKGDQQKAERYDLLDALNDIIDNFNLTDTDRQEIIDILNEYDISFEE